jgi:hypothetical protein
MIAGCMRLAIVWALPLATLAADASSAAFHLKVGRYGAAAVAISNTVYLAGGSGEQGMLDSIEAFDLATGTTRLLDLKVLPRRYHAASAWSNGFVLVGGTAYQREDQVEWINPILGTLHLLPPLPRPRSFVSTAVVKGKLLVVGGNLPSSTRCGFVDIFDRFATGTWAREGPGHAHLARHRGGRHRQPSLCTRRLQRRHRGNRGRAFGPRPHGMGKDAAPCRKSKAPTAPSTTATGCIFSVTTKNSIACWPGGPKRATGACWTCPTSRPAMPPPRRWEIT